MSPNVAQTRQIYDTILVLDFGSQYSHLIARRVRELGVYCELWACTVDIESLGFQPKGVILSGGPSSVFEKDAPHVQEALLCLGIPLLGICYGLQEIAWRLGGNVLPATKRGYGHSTLAILENHGDLLLANLPAKTEVWMSHGDHVDRLPQGFRSLAVAESAPFAVISDPLRKIWGMQFHPEVTHTTLGKTMLRNFVIGICQCEPRWTMSAFIETEIERIRCMVGDEAHVVGAVSGGVDSTVAAALMQRAIGHRFHAIIVDHGFMRLDEVNQVRHRLEDTLGVHLRVVDASELFFSRIKGVTDPEKKRKIAGNTFIQVFEEQAKGLGDIRFLLQGTLYPDVIESVSFKGPSATIKTHHNVGGLLEDMKLSLIEPLRELFKDEVRQLGAEMGIDEELIWRHPFPGPGLCIRILGEVTREQVQLLQKADAIFIEEIRTAGLYRSIAQAFAVLLPVQSVGVMGDQRTYEQVVALRAVETTDYMTATWYPMPYEVLKIVSSRIINEIRGINRVTYDISSKPPATIEWE